MTQSESVARFSHAQSQMNHFPPLSLFPYFKHFLLSSSLFGSFGNISEHFYIRGPGDPATSEVDLVSAL